MTHQKMKEVIEKKLKKLNRLYNKLLKDFDENDIHDFRVEIKKLRAFLRLLRIAQPHNKKIKLPKELKSFYSSIGTIRNLQVQIDRINKEAVNEHIKTPDQFLKGLTKDESLEMEKLKNETGSIHFNSIKRKLFKNIPLNFNKQAAVAFGVQKSVLLQNLISSIYYDETLHDIRKILKDFLYDWKYIEGSLTPMLPIYLATPQHIEAVTKKLGDFQDDVILLRFLQPLYVNQMADFRERESLEILRKHILQEKDSLKEEIKNELKGLVPEKVPERPYMLDKQF